MLDLRPRRIGRHPQIIIALQIHPEFAGGRKVAAQPKGGVGSDASRLIHDRADARGRNTKGESQAIDADPRRAHEFFEQNLAGMNRGCYGLLGHFPTSVIIDNLHVPRISVRPHKTQPVLDIDPYRVLPFAVASECFERIARTSQIAECFCGMKHDQLAEGDPLNSTEFPAVLFPEDLFSFSAAERNNQKTML